MADRYPAGTVPVDVTLGARSYEVVIGPDLLVHAGRILAEGLAAGHGRDAVPARVAIVTDSNVESAHGERLRASLDAASIRHSTTIMKPGEGTKSLDGLGRLLDALLDERVERNDLIVAFGGGVIGDLTGFAAGILRRGVRVVQIPTSLLAQVDSSVGGKTGINTRHGKNLVGVFHQPSLVLADTDVLDTLSAREFRAGYAEMVKYGLIDQPDFFDWMERNRKAIFEGGERRIEAIATSCRTKAKIVATDEYESGDRALLNFGHTFAHALEGATGYDSSRLVHGEAVSIGMVLAHRFSNWLNLASRDDADRVERHLKEAGLPVSIHDIKGELPDVDRLMRHIGQDKKVQQGNLTFILTRGIGKAMVAENVAADPLRGFLADQLAMKDKD